MNIVFLFLKALGAPDGDEGSAQSSSERKPDGCGSITQVSAAAGPGGGVSSGQQGSWFSFIAERWGQAASSLQAHQSTDVEG